MEAALAIGSDDLNRAVKRARVLSEKRNEEPFIPYAQAYIRCFNLTKKVSPQALDSSLLVDATEIALENAISLRIARFEQTLARGNYVMAYTLAEELVPHIEALFQAVMIMVEDEALKRNRLALLGQCVVMLGCLGDLSVLA